MLSHLNDSKLEARLLSAVLGFELAKDMFTGGLWILSFQSLTWRIAQLSTYPSILAIVWMSLSFLILPFLLMQMFGWFTKYSSYITKLACRATLASGVIWTYLSYLSKNLDYQYITEIYLFNGFTCVAMSAILAFSLNSAQIRAAEENK